MAIWDPWKEFSRMEREMRRLFDELWGVQERIGKRVALPGKGEKAVLPVEKREALVGTPPVDLVDKDDFLILRSEMPGVKKDNIKISITDDEVTLLGKVEQKKEEKEEDYYYSERSYSSWQRTIPLPVKIKSDKVKAKYEDGVLEITLPKVEEEKKKKKEIKIE